VNVVVAADGGMGLGDTVWHCFFVFFFLL
jgi:hypothetical protein